ncbi:MAG: SRPBCC family protein [Acidimicrobiales bacterium]|nr:SRPBCC family protein [Acidimicrobiales bacterium]
MPDQIVVERSQHISAAPADVFAHVVDLTKWGQWSPWDSKDPNMQKTFTGDAGTVGSGYSWVGNRNVGEGRMTITDVDAPNRVTIDLEFLKPFKDHSVSELSVAQSGDGSQVTWKMITENTLMKKFMGIFKSLDKMVGPDFEKGLAGLKRITEA